MFYCFELTFLHPYHKQKKNFLSFSSYLLVVFLFFLFFFFDRTHDSFLQRLDERCPDMWKNSAFELFWRSIKRIKKNYIPYGFNLKTEARIIFLTVATYFLKLATINKCLTFISMVWWWSYYFLNIPTLFSNFSENTVLSGKLSLAYFLPLISFYNP